MKRCHSSSPFFILICGLSDPAVYPYSLEVIYPAVASSTSLTARVPTVEKPNGIASKVVSGHVRKPSWKRGLPPVPPLPKNVHTLTPFSAASGRPLLPARIGMRIPIELPLAYPNVCPCMYHGLSRWTAIDEILRRPARVSALRSVPCTCCRGHVNYRCRVEWQSGRGIAVPVFGHL